MNIHLVEVSSIDISFSEVSTDKDTFLYEFVHSNENEEDPINQWLKLARAKGEVAQTDPVLLNLMVELHKKVDALERFLKNEEPKKTPLSYDISVESIGFEHFKLTKDVLSEGVEYYARVSMPIYPQRDIKIFFRAVDASLAKITKIHERDEKEWGAYILARERALIRQAKESKE